MMTFVAIIHLIVAFLLIGLVLVQDSKGGGLGLGGGGGGGTNSLLGATGAQSLAAKATRWVAVFFAITCISLTLLTVQSSRSVIDGRALPAASGPINTEPAESAVPATESAPQAPTEP